MVITELYLKAIHAYFLAVPTRGPSPLSAEISGSSNLVVTWASLEPQFRLGVILGYRVYCTNLKTGLGVFADSTSLTATCTGLHPNTKHNITVSAKNSKGFGPNGSTIVKLSGESGNQYLYPSTFVDFLKYWTK